MSGVKSESHQKKKPTRHIKRKRTGVSGDLHLISERPNENGSILIAGENDEDNVLTIVSPDRGVDSRPVGLFDDVSRPSILSPLRLHDEPPVNTRFTKFKTAVTKKSSTTLDDKCVLTLLRPSFVQTAIGELKTRVRQPVHIKIARKEAINKFRTSTYAKRKRVDANRRSIRNQSLTSDKLGNDASVEMKPVFDLSSRNIRRYIIEDIMYLSVRDFVTIVVDVDSGNSDKWKRISVKQQFNYDNIQIGDRLFYQIPCIVRSNNRKDEFTSGHHDNDTINYLVLNKGGAGLTVDFVVNGSDKCTEGVELKFSDFFLSDHLQMWGCKAMVRNLVYYIKKRTNKESMDSLLYCFLRELRGDCAQTIQLCAAMEYIDKKGHSSEACVLSGIE